MAIGIQSILAATLILATCAASGPSHPEPRAASSPKYFREPGGSLARMHYDLRYFKGEAAYDDRQSHLRDLVRSYLDVMRSKGVETWLAHGTLLGWWWNARIMPWDYDLDVQVSNGTMDWLASNLNGTTHEYASGEERLDEAAAAAAAAAAGAANATRTRTYLLDINPHYVDAGSRGGGGNNVIDGRWIDTENGMFVDITVLGERDPRRRPGEWSCKNGHRYAAQDIWPLRLTEFEQVPARIPYNVDDILKQEYSQKSLSKETHQYHQWDHDLKQWVMDDPEQRGRLKDAAALHKKQQLERQGRL
ncbi:hypothetical protein G3M48_009040 [Beauveria asiatica]|uniref:LicD/FKTN/FKRP nucleotidyltransferase domain-containing protein n=1 Tax=Beauveria asiatica TaxID=1069075 RepID=A0AAW0S3L6_9HYPO